MRNIFIALTVLVTLGGGCTDSDDDSRGGGGGGDGGGGGGDDGGGGGGGGPPFTDGVSTLSGSTAGGYGDGPRGVARFSNPVNVAFGPDGVVYVADFDNGKIRAVNADTGTTSTAIAVSGFQRPFGLAFAGNGTLYVATDRDPQGKSGPMAGTIWRVDLAARTATAIAPRIGRPRGLAVLPDGRIAASDYTHDVIMLVNPSTGGVTTLAGAWDAKGMVDATGAAARFSTPYGIAFVNGALVVADQGNHRLRRVELNGRVTTLAGSGTAGFADGSVASAQFNRPQGVAAAANGDICVTDLENYRVRRIRGGKVETIAGTGQPGYQDNDDPLAAQLYGLEGLTVKPDGSMVFVADGSRGEDVPHHMIRSIKIK